MPSKLKSIVSEPILADCSGSSFSVAKAFRKDTLLGFDDDASASVSSDVPIFNASAPFKGERLAKNLSLCIESTYIWKRWMMNLNNAT